MRTQYYKYHPRNFRNEFTVIKVTTQEELKALKEWEDDHVYGDRRLYRVTLKDLSYDKASERYRRKYDTSMAGYCNPDSPISVADFLDRRF